jgi:outer membrane lipoprotein carrier protein
LLLVMLVATVQADNGRALVDAFVSDIDTFEADFRQSLLDANGTVIEESSGTLEIRRPGQFRWDNIEPYEQWLIADGTNIWSYDVDLEQVTVKPQTQALANTPALILSGDDSAFDQFEFVETYEEGPHTWVRLAPVDDASGFTRMDLGFVDGTLDRMVFFDTLEQTTLVQFDDVAVNEAIDPARFEFNVPDGVDLIGTPAARRAD